MSKYAKGKKQTDIQGQLCKRAYSRALNNSTILQIINFKNDDIRGITMGINVPVAIAFY